jgi:hypothetical protein
MQRQLLQDKHELINLESKTLKSKLTLTGFISCVQSGDSDSERFVLLVKGTPLSSCSCLRDPCVDGSLAARLQPS